MFLSFFFIFVIILLHNTHKMCNAKLLMKHFSFFNVFLEIIDELYFSSFWNFSSLL